MALTIDKLRDELAHHLQDPANRLVNRDQLLEFINSAAWDASTNDWLLPLDNESLLESTGTYEYNVPSDFLYIHEVWEESAVADRYDRRIVRNQWRILLVSTTPTLVFDSDLFTITDARNLKLVGHKRPTTEYGDSDSIDTGLESFIRERAVSYAARNLSRHGGAMAQQYAALAEEAWQKSEALLQNRPEQYQLHIRSRLVPGR
jgi:hypothetical protein